MREKSSHGYHKWCDLKLRDHVLLGYIKSLVRTREKRNQLRVAPPAMRFDKPYSPRMVVLMMAPTLVSISAPIHAQEVSSAVTSRVESDAVLVPTVEKSDERASGLELGAVIAVAYDDNIFLSKSKPEADTVIRVSPTVVYIQGDAKAGEGGFIAFAYRPTNVAYLQNHTENRIDQQAALTAGWRGKVSQITYTGAVQKLADATSDTGRQTDRMEFANEIRGAWMPREKIALELAAGSGQIDYDDRTLFDSMKTYGEIAVRYAYSPKTQVGLAYQAGRYEVDGASIQTTHQITANIDWKPREKIHVKLQAGAEQRVTDSGTDINPVVEGRIDWAPRQGTNLYLTAYQREAASAYYAGQNYSLKGVTAGISQRLGGKWTARLEAGQEKSSYHQVSGSGGGARKDKIWFVRPALEYRINDQCNVSLFYRVTDNSSSASAFGYSQRMAGLELQYKF